MLVSYVIWLDLPPKLEEYNREHCSVWWNNRPNAGYIIRVVIRKIRRLKSSRFTHQLTTTCWKRKIIHLITSYLTQQTGKLGGWGGGGVKWLCLFFFWARNCLYLRLWWLSDFDGSRYHRTLQSQRRLFTPSKFRWLCLTFVVVWITSALI